MDRQVGDRYRLVEPLGEGGMGVVWRAYDELLDRTVAIKEVRYSGVGERQRAELNRRTIREARAAGRLDHPSVVVIHDVVEEDGRPWIVMQLVRSRSLAEVIRADGPLPVRRAAAIGARVLDALRAAHATGVLHRDVKPENVLLADDGRVVLTDFGIATMESEAGLTATGNLVGTPAYMPPERLNGEPARPESDLWSLGATLYAAVEGAPPFRRDSWAATVAAVLRDAVEPPGRAGALTPVIKGWLQRDPGNRLPADQAAHLLDNAASGPRNSPPPYGPGPREIPPYDPTGPAPHAAAPTGPYPSSAPRAAVPSDPYPSSAPRAAVPSDPYPSPAPHGAAPSGSHAGPGPHAPAGSGPGGSSPPYGPSGTAGTVPAGRSAGKRWAVVAAVAVVALLGAGGALIVPRLGDGPGPRKSTSGDGTPGPESSGDGTPGQGDRAGTPAGWRVHRNAAGRFTVAMPRGWRAVKSPQRDSVTFSGPGTPGVMIVEWTVPEGDHPTPAAHWRALEREILARGEFPGYERIAIRSLVYQGRPAADWEFTRTRAGGRIHVINRGFTAAGGRPFALYWETKGARWERDRRFFETFARTFRVTR
ncbi:protein kinase [Nonomuraea sp. MCN248]|uniref:non-specific serine/threonine protein kinase n=1 Tax=Nonomuraea corallina TaxID=2989783 RepID=A0ABT4SDY9_9ACTN|nr:serine/threonine protein kinase [Nonomuraea corallina]MDA0635190.1 protein kinase [Nonomuraea corallina]